MFPLGAPYFGVALQRYSILLDVADVVCSRQQPGQLFRDLLPHLRATIPCNFLNYAVHNPSHNAMQMFLWDGGEPWPDTAEEVAVEESAVGWVWRNQHVLSLDDVEQEQRFARGLRWLRAHRARSYCVLPLTTTHHRIGALGIASTKIRAFGVPDQYFLLRVAELIALSLDDTQPQSALIEERERVRLLFDISNLKTRLEGENALEPQERISQFLGPVQNWAGRSYVGFYLYDQESRSLRLFTREPQLGPRLVADGTAPLEGSVAGRVFRNGKSEILSHADLRRLSFASVRRGLELGVRSLCMVPVLRDQQPVGVLKMASRKDRAFSARDVEVLSEVAAMAGAFVGEIQLPFQESQEAEQSPAFLKVSNGFWTPTERANRHREPAKLLPFVAGEAVHDVHQMLADYFTSSTVGLCILDLELRYLFINKRLADMNGQPAQAHLGRTIDDVMGAVAAKIRPALEQVLNTGEPVLNFELTGTLPTASAPGHWLETYFPIKNSEGEINRIGVAAMEIAKNRNLDESTRYLRDRLREEQNRLQVLRDIDIALAGNLNLKQLFAASASCLEKAIPFDLAGIWLYDPTNQTMRTAAIESRVGDAFIQDESVPLSECMLGQSMLTGEPVSLSLAELSSLSVRSARLLLKHEIKSVCSVPLITPRGPLGAMGLGSREDRAFTPEDVDLLSHAATSIALALEIALTHEALRREKDQLQALSEISSALSRSKADFQQTFPVVSTCMQKIVRYDMAAVDVLDRAAERVRIYSLDYLLPPGVFTEGLTVALHESLLSQLQAEHLGRNFNLEELEVYARHLKRLRRVLDEGVQSLCYVPLITARGLMGALILGRKGSDVFNAEDLGFLRRMAPELALSVESASAHEALGREKERLQALREIDAVLVANIDLDTFLPEISGCLSKAVPHRDIGFYLYDEKSKVLRDYLPRSGTKSKMVPGGVLPVDGSIAGQVFLARTARVVDHAEMNNFSYAAARRALEQGVRSLCFIPLITSTGPLGVLVLSSDQDNTFQGQDVEFLEQVAAALAQSMQNASAHKALQEEKKRLQVLLNVSSVLTSNWNVQETFGTISSYLRRVLRHECAFLSLYEQKNKIFVRQAQDFPLGKGLLDAVTPVSHGGPQALAVSKQRPVIFSRNDVEALRSEAPQADWANGFLGEGLKSMCCVPLLRPKGPLGTLTLASTRAEAFAADDAELLNQVASQLAIALENAGISREVDELNSRMEEEKRYLQGEPATGATFEGIIGDSPVLRQVLEQVATVAGSEATTLILGETGTGKELIARAIHRMSGRRDRAFIKLNCAAIPTGLLESELFGHEKGAFTGAIQQKIGRLELADRGTLFLDEVGEIPLELQPKLLRVLQDHEFERLGGTRTIKANLRLVAATNRQLAKSVASGDFRSDLFYRLNVFPIRMPALRERRQDIPVLVRHFVHKFAGTMERKIESVPTETMQALLNYHWPGNVRELENLIERSVILSQGATLRVPVAELLDEAPSARAGDTLENAEREHIIRVLRETRGIVSGPSGAANKLGLKRTTLQSKMQRLGITRKDY